MALHGLGENDLKLSGLQRRCADRTDPLKDVPDEGLDAMPLQRFKLGLPLKLRPHQPDSVPRRLAEDQIEAGNAGRVALVVHPGQF